MSQNSTEETSQTSTTEKQQVSPQMITLPLTETSGFCAIVLQAHEIGKFKNKKYINKDETGQIKMQIKNPSTLSPVCGLF